MMTRKAYPTDLKDNDWAILCPLVPAVKPGGRPADYDRREIMNGILYVLRSGGAWRMMPHDLPPWDTVYGYFNRGRKAGSWEQLHQTLYRQLRIEIGRNPEASAA